MKFPILDLLIGWTEIRLKQDRRATLAEEYVSLVTSRICYEADPVYCEIGQVVERSGLPYPSVARILKQLCERGLLAAAKHPDDARRTVYTPVLERVASPQALERWKAHQVRMLTEHGPTEEDLEKRRQDLERTHRLLRIN